VKLRMLLGVLVLGMAAGCGGGDDDGGGGGGGDQAEPVQFELNEVDGSGKTVTVLLEPGVGTTEAQLSIEPVRGTNNAPIHVHKGSCDTITPDAEVAHDIGFFLDGLGQGSVFVPMEEIATGEFVIDVHDPSGAKIIACGAIPAQ
jgi:hypothetical protein